MALVSGAPCSIADVKGHLDPGKSNADDATIELMINAFAASFERITERRLALTARTEYFDASGAGLAGGPTALLRLPAYPISESPAPVIYDDPARAFAASTLLTENADYVVDYRNGLIRKISASWFELGFSSPNRVGPGTVYSHMTPDSFRPGRLSIKVTWTGGLVTPRPAGPAAPSVAANGAGNVNGTVRYRIATITSGVETVASTSTAFVANNNIARLTFAAPGASSTTRIYRMKSGQSIYYRVADVAGTATQYDDNIADGSLDTATLAKEEGPISAPDDLREACVMQTTLWFQRRSDPGRISISGTGQGQVVYARADRGALLPFVQSVFDSYTQIPLGSV